MFCSKCGGRMPDDAMFCNACGGKNTTEITGNVTPSQQEVAETALLELRPHWLSQLSLVIWGVLLSWLGIGLVFIGLAIYRIYAYQYTITTQRIMINQGLIARNMTDVNIGHIRAINVQQSMFDRMFNIGCLNIGTAATAGTEIRIRYVKNPVDVKNTILNQKTSSGVA